MPQNTFTLIEKITVGAAGASSITFTSIPQTYTDLKIVVSGRSTVNGETAMNIYFNGSTTAVYDRISLSGNGSAASSASATNQGEIFAGRVPANDYTSSTFGNTEIYIPNYTGSNNKSVSFDSVSEQNATTAFQVLIAGLWKNSAAITSATLSIAGANFVQYTTAYLYGIAKEGVSPSPSSAPYATGGDSIVFDGTYWYHTFLSSGTFTPKKSLSCDVLQIAGGGATIGWMNGGGGGGGVSYLASQALSTTGYTVTVGAGGSGGSGAGGGNSQWGNASQFGSLTAATRGGSGGSQGYDGGTGGSGGGAGANSPAKTGGTGTQGSNGGNSVQYAGGGGGGYSAAGSNASGTTAGGAGGAGTSTYSSWGLATGTGHNVSGTVYYAGGGGGGGQATGGTGGNGGGGAGAGGLPVTQTAGTSGTANTGGGAGGGSDYQTTAVTNANGGSGIVIVRYAA